MPRFFCPIDGRVAISGDSAEPPHCPICGSGVGEDEEPVLDFDAYGTDYVGDREIDR